MLKENDIEILKSKFKSGEAIAYITHNVSKIVDLERKNKLAILFDEPNNNEKYLYDSYYFLNQNNKKVNIYILNKEISDIVFTKALSSIFQTDYSEKELEIRRKYFSQISNYTNEKIFNFKKNINKFDNIIYDISNILINIVPKNIIENRLNHYFSDLVYKQNFSLPELEYDVNSGSTHLNVLNSMLNTINHKNDSLFGGLFMVYFILLNTIII